jgi:enoyl-CoA hydratase/carnithine racemase
LACDFIIASEWANFAWSYIHRGIIPDGGGMYFLPRRVGLSKAKELIFTGRKVDVDEALALGIVDRKTAAATLVTDAQAWAAELGKGSSTALAPYQDDHQPDLRALCAERLRARESGAGHLLHEH